jgi:hypothetical protein
LRNTPAKMIQLGDSRALSKAILEEMKVPSKQIADAFASEASVRFDVRRQARELEITLRQLICGKLKKGSAPTPY